MKSLKQSLCVSLLVTGMICSSTPAIAINNGFFAGFQFVSCSEYLRERALNSVQYRVGFAAYVIGYLQAYNEHKPETYNVLGNLEIPDALRMVAKNCERIPTNDLSQSMSDLVVELYPTRSMR